MKAKMKLEGDRLEITFTDVVEANRSCLANISIDLLRAYGHDFTPAWHWQDEKAVVQFIRRDSDCQVLEKARKVLRGYAFEV